MKTKIIRQSEIFKAPPHEIYELLLDSKKHSKFTGSKSEIVRKVGGEFSAYDGYNRGKLLELVPNRKIVIALRHDEDDWPEDHFSKITIRLSKNEDGTKLTFTQSAVPSQHAGHLAQGWKDHYWEPMKAMLEKG